MLPSLLLLGSSSANGNDAWLSRLSNLLLQLPPFIGNSAGAVPGEGTVRHYYIAAEDVVWDFAPTDQNLVHCMDEQVPCSLPEPWTTGHTFPVVRYIEYTDETFSTPKPQPEWLGILGPIIRAEVGDTVKVHFCNQTATGAYSMHPYGLRYTKDNEGAHYFGVNLPNTLPGAGAQVAPGKIAGSPMRTAALQAVSFLPRYGGTIPMSDAVAGTNAGLLGPIIVTHYGMANADGGPGDVDREFVTAFFIFDKQEGEEAGLMHSINGYIFGNLRGLIAKQGEQVRWHVLGMGNEVDLHTPHWHGETVLVGAQHVARRTDYCPPR